MVAPSESCCDLQGSPQPDFSQKTGQFDMKSYQMLFFDGGTESCVFLGQACYKIFRELSQVR